MATDPFKNLQTENRILRDTVVKLKKEKASLETKNRFLTARVRLLEEAPVAGKRLSFMERKRLERKQR